jgi:hypothetical protein
MSNVRRVIAATMAAMTVPLVTIPLVLAPAASADTASPPYIDHVEWAKWADLNSLRVYPTQSGRIEAGQLGTNAQAEEAWTEVLALSRDADTPGIKAQFLCHWHFAEFAQPGKTSWNLEPWRPVVTDDQMVATGCNPGGIEEPF